MYVSIYPSTYSIYTRCFSPALPCAWSLNACLPQLVSYEQATRGGAPSVRMVRSPHDPPGRLVPDVYLEELGGHLGGGNPLATFIPM